jgi:hypothetical protein
LRITTPLQLHLQTTPLHHLHNHSAQIIVLCEIHSFILVNCATEIQDSFWSVCHLRSGHFLDCRIDLCASQKSSSHNSITTTIPYLGIPSRSIDQARISSSSSDCRGDIRLFISHKRYGHSSLGANNPTQTSFHLPFLHPFTVRPSKLRVANKHPSLSRTSIVSLPSSNAPSDIKSTNRPALPSTHLPTRWIKYKPTLRPPFRPRTSSLPARCRSQVVLVNLLLPHLRTISKTVTRTV